MDKQETELWIAEIIESDYEVWHTDIEANSRKEVIVSGMKLAKEGGLSSFRIGQYVLVEIPTIDVDSILEDAYEQDIAVAHRSGMERSMRRKFGQV